LGPDRDHLLVDAGLLGAQARDLALRIDRIRLGAVLQGDAVQVPHHQRHRGDHRGALGGGEVVPPGPDFVGRAAEHVLAWDEP
jgi:hypothetical protein